MSNKKDLLDALKTKMLRDDSLPLKTGATQLVFGVGNSDSIILFIGEGPGYWEDIKGDPFVGNAGKFLDTLLQSIKLPRSEVYITNVVHHRPPSNRDPFPEEIAAYGMYLDEIIKIVDPRIIVTLGRFSMAKFLPYARISAVHGKSQVIDWRGKKMTIVPMYHPAACLRSTEIKRQGKEDFLKLPEVIAGLVEEEKKPEVKQLNLV